MTAPNDERHQDSDDRQIAIYSLLDQDTKHLEKLEHDLRAADDISDKPITRLATSANFANKTLLDIYNHHIATRDQDTMFHPLYFIVADQQHWKKKGVLFVNLHASTEDHKSFIGVCRCDLEIATQIRANLSIANMDWLDYKEMEQDEFGGEDPYENKRYYDSNPAERNAS